MRVGGQYDRLGVSDPSGDGSVAHAFRQQPGNAGVAEPVDLDVGEARLLDVFVDPPPDLAMADGDHADYSVEDKEALVKAAEIILHHEKRK